MDTFSDNVINHHIISNVYFQPWFRELFTLIGSRRYGDGNLDSELNVFCHHNLEQMLKSINIKSIPNLQYSIISYIEHYQLQNNEPEPKYIMIIYFTSHGIHFHGGELELSNGLVISPQCGDILFIDERKISRARRLINGIRQCIMIRFT